MPNIALWCIICEDRSIFKVTIGTGNDLFDLRKAILEELPNAENVKATQLTLWRTNTASNVLRDKETAIEPYLNEKLEDPADTVRNTFINVVGNNIRVIVGVPVTEQPVTVPKDITAEIIKQLVQSPGQLPNRSDLAKFLNENPPVKIPLIPVHFFQFKTGDLDGITEEERDIYFIQNAEEECTSLYSKLLGQLIYPPSYGKNEDSYHGLWDSIIKNTIEIFGKQNASLPTLEFDRNTSKRTTTGRNRPDMVVLVRNVCPFRGEEKSRDDAGDPSKELTEKFKGWNYGDAPYLFAYYAVGVLVTFVTLHKPINKSHNKRKRSVYSERIAEFDLGRLSDRIRVMNFLRNICRILPIIVNLCPQRDSPDFETKIRSNGTVIELGYAVTKKFTDEEQVIHLKEIYGMLQANSVRFSDKLEYSSKHSVHLVPRGEQQEPSDLKELLQALICILTCLEGMHLIKPKPIMHRDVRWPNIIRHYDEYLRFILIDFDYATFSPADMSLEEFSESDHAPEMLTKKHNFKVDIWGVGNLVVSCNITGIPQELKSFSADLCNNSPSKRPTASNALNRAKEMFRKWFTNDDWLKIVETATHLGLLTLMVG